MGMGEIKMQTLKPKALVVALTPILVIGLAACSPMGASFSPNPTPKKTSGPDAEPEPTPPIVTEKPDLMKCLNTTPDFTLAPSLVNFQMTDSTGVSVGANAGIGGVPIGAKLGVTYDTGKLMTSMRVTRPIYGPNPLPDTLGEAIAEKIGFDIGLSASIANIGFSQFTQTPLAKMSNEALIKNLQGVVMQTLEPWTTQVSDIYNDLEIEVPVGANAGIRMGDEFAVYKVEYIWDGEPCQSRLKIIRRALNFPIATVVASQAPAGNTAILLVKELVGNYRIEKHDQLVISKLVTETKTDCTTDWWTGKQTCKTVDVPRPALKRSVRLEPTTGEPIPFATANGTVPMNINPMMDKLMELIIGDPTSTFYIVK